MNNNVVEIKHMMYIRLYVYIHLTNVNKKKDPIGFEKHNYGYSKNNNAVGITRPVMYIYLYAYSI
jgi:hypothetical protein